MTSRQACCCALSVIGAMFCGVAVCAEEIEVPVEVVAPRPRADTARVAEVNTHQSGWLSRMTASAPLNSHLPGCGAWDGIPSQLVVRGSDEYAGLIEKNCVACYDAYQADAGGAGVKLIGFADFSDRCCHWLPDLDLAGRMLLKQNGTGTCHVTGEPRVFRDDSRRRLRYVLTVVESGGCEMATTISTWIVVPSVPPDYDIVFETTHRRL